MKLVTLLLLTEVSPFIVGTFLSNQLFFKFNTTSIHSGRIVNGEPAKIGEFPYFVLLYRLISSSRNTLCGGAIISSYWILTAAHCLDGNAQKIFAITGINSKELVKKENVNRAAAVIKHNDPDYDIGLIKLGRELTFTKNIQPIYLPHRDYHIEPNAPAVIMGFGKTDSDGTKTSSFLKKLSVRIAPQDECYDGMYQETFSAYYLCTFNDNSGPCLGDSGGPLVTEDGVVAGIMSSGPEICANPEVSILYTKVSNFREWIQYNTGI